MKTLSYPTPQAAEAAFYAALEQADVDAMMAVWAMDEDIACVHPMGPRLTGRHAVAEGWRRIFRGGPSMRFRASDVRMHQSDGLSVHTMHENILLPGREAEGESLVIATNVYRLTDRGWRLILHHASPAPSRSRDDGPETPRVMH